MSVTFCWRAPQRSILTVTRITTQLYTDKRAPQDEGIACVVVIVSVRFVCLFDVCLFVFRSEYPATWAASQRLRSICLHV